MLQGIHDQFVMEEEVDTMELFNTFREPDWQDFR